MDSRKKERTEKVYDDVYTLKAIHGQRTYRNKPQFLVSWLGYDLKSWEYSENIPKFITDFYIQSGQKEIDIPEPRIRHTKVSGKERYALLRWENCDASDQYVNVKDLLIEAIEGQEDIAKSICNTKKHLGRRFYSRNAGLMIAAWPCGVVPMVEELYGVESLSQVHGLLCDFLHTGKDMLTNLQTIFYDDACHLKPYAQKKERMEASEAAKHLGELEMCVDFFHIKNHVDKYCHENLNPYTKDHLKNINSSVCEQTFSWMNRFMQTKSMNRARYLFFFIYLLDRHNLRKEGRLHETHPRFKANEMLRDADANSNVLDFENKCQSEQTLEATKGAEGAETDVEGLTSDLMGMKIDQNTKTQEKPVLPCNEELEKKAKEFPCSECAIKTIKTAAGLKKHLFLIHKIDNEAHLRSYKCEKCGTSFKQKYNLTRHLKTTKCSK